MRHGKILVRGWIGPDGKPRAEATALSESADAGLAARSARSKGEHATVYDVESSADLALPDLKNVNPILAVAKLQPLEL